MAASSKAKGKQVFDVSKPGKSMPSPTSRPVISSHGPIMRDPMVSDADKTTEDTAPTDKKLKMPAKKVIAPLKEVKLKPTADAKKTKEDSEPQVPELDISVDTPQDETPTADIEKENKEESEKTKEPTEKPTDSPDKADEADARAAEAATMDIIAEQALKDKKGGMTAEELEKQNALEQHITDKTYFVPVGQVAKRRNRRIMILLFILVLLASALAGFYAAQEGLVTIDLPF
jgi:hypothetical protein